MTEQWQKRNSTEELLLNWPVFNSRKVSIEIWTVLPYAIIWCRRIRNAVIFNNGRLEFVKVVQSIKATVWTWLSMPNRAMELRKKISFSDVLLEWRPIMTEQCCC